MQQLDIFADTLPVQRANALIAALARLDRAACWPALQALAEVDPDHAGLAHWRVLCDFVTNWPAAGDELRAPDNAAAVAEAERMIAGRIVPAAGAMGQAGALLLRRCWSDLARRAEAAGVGPQHPEACAAELHLRAGQARDAVRTARGIPGADLRAAVQRWLALGNQRCGEKEAGLTSTLRYAWLAPQRFNALVEELSDRELARNWRSFDADLGDLDATWFPAWLANEKKCGATIADNVPPGDGPQAYRLVVGLSRREHDGLCPAVYEDRKRLKQLDDGFFAYYMRHRSDPRQHQPHANRPVPTA